MLNELKNYLPKLDLMNICSQFKAVDIKSDLSKRIFKVAFSVFFTASTALNRENLTLLIRKAFYVFCGHSGWVTPTVMISTCLAIKYLLFLNQKSDDPKISYTTRTITWLKEIPENFLGGVTKFPESLILRISTVIIAELIFESLSINASVCPKYKMYLEKESAFQLVIKSPFLEELFFREFAQGSLISAMKIINLVALHLNKDVIIREKSLYTISRIFSSVIFGLAHSNQNLTQSAVAGLSSYFYTTLLYEKNGLFASVGIHMANNFFAQTLMIAKSITRYFE